MLYLSIVQLNAQKMELNLKHLILSACMSQRACIGMTYHTCQDVEIFYVSKTIYVAWRHADISMYIATVARDGSIGPISANN